MHIIGLYYHEERSTSHTSCSLQSLVQYIQVQEEKYSLLILHFLDSHLKIVSVFDKNNCWPLKRNFILLIIIYLYKKS